MIFYDIKKEEHETVATYVNQRGRISTWSGSAIAFFIRKYFEESTTFIGSLKTLRVCSDK